MDSTTRRRRAVVAITGALVIAALTGCTGPGAAESTATPTRTAAADRETVTPTPSASPNASRSATPSTGYQVDDPSTWTISGDEVGPIALGGKTEEETDDLTAAYTLSDDECPASPTTQFWGNGKNPALIVTSRDGQVSGVAVGNDEPHAVTAASPTTAAGAGVSTSLTDLQRLYPALEYLGTYGEERASYSYWGVDDRSGHITFQLGEDGVHVGMVWVSSDPQPPYEFCG